jgi:spore coat protein U-like protein
MKFADTPWLKTGLAASLLLAGLSAHAAITCSSLTASVPQAVFNANTPTPDATGSVSITCTRSNPATDPNTLSISLRSDGGTNPGTTRARLGATANYLNYDLFRQPSFTTVWRNTAANGMAITVNFAAGQATSSASASFVSRVPVAAANWALPPGLYTETVNVSAVYGATTISTTMLVAIDVQSVCIFSTVPADINFTYTAFMTTAQVGSSNFAMQCTNTAPYNLALDSPSGVVAGLNYSLSLSATSANGNGAAQARTVNATMPANQAGTCNAASCAAQQGHTITVSY